MMIYLPKWPGPVAPFDACSPGIQRLDPLVQIHSFVGIGHEIISTAILSLSP